MAVEIEQRRDIHEREEKLNARMNEQPVVVNQPKFDRNKQNIFEAASENSEEYQKRLEEMKREEKLKQEQSHYNAFRDEMQQKWAARTGDPGQYSAAQSRLLAGLNGAFEPISKERNRELLAELDEGIKKMDGKVDDKAFGQVFSEYVVRYQQFVHDMNEYQNGRIHQAQLMENIHFMIGAANSMLQ